MPIDPTLLAQLTTSPTQISIVKLIGKDLFDNLSYELGGHRIYIPANPSPGCPLAVAIGLDAARLMGEVWGGFEYDIPLKEGRKQIIIKMLDAGMPVVRISAHLRLSIRTIRRVSSSMKAENQMALPFGDDNL